jgi:cell division protein FtsN
MTKLFIKNLIIFLAILIVSSCSKGSGKKIRIVDLQGKSHAVKTKVPELNAQILESQGRLVQQENIFANNSENQVVALNEITQNAVVENNVKTTENNAQDINIQNSAESNQKIVTENQNKYPTADYKAAEIELANQKAKSEDSTLSNKIKVSAGNVFDNKETEVEYDLSKVKKEKKLEKKDKKITDSSNNILSGIYVQTGAFSNIENAQKDESFVKKYAKSQIEESSSNDKKIFRVFLGPFSNKTEANKIINKLKADNHDAVIVKRN